MRECRAVAEIGKTGGVKALNGLVKVLLGLADVVDEVVVARSDDFVSDGLDAGEVVVDRRSCDAGLASDRAQRERVGAVVDQARGGLDDLLAQPASFPSCVSLPGFR